MLGRLRCALKNQAVPASQRRCGGGTRAVDVAFETSHDLGARPGNRLLTAMLVEAAQSASRTKATPLSERGRPSDHARARRDAAAIVLTGALTGT